MVAKSEKKLFIFDDDTALMALLHRIAQKRFQKIFTAPTCKKALELVEAEVGDFDLVITDLNFPDGSGLDILRAAKTKSSLTSVVVFTGFASLETAIQALHEGAFDYITKPFTVEQVLALLNKMESYIDLQCENIQLRRRLDESSSFLNRQNARYQDLSNEFQSVHSVLKVHGDTLQRIVMELERFRLSLGPHPSSKP